MNIWSIVKRRMKTKQAKAIKKKAAAAGELVAAEADLTGGALLLEEAVKPGEPQLAGHDNVYATDNGATLFKYKILAEEEDGITTAQIIGYILLVLIAIILLFPIACVILKIIRMCGHDVSAFEWIGSKKVKDNHPKGSNKDEHSETPTASPSMEKTLKDLNNNSILNHQHAEHNLEEAIKKARKNFGALTSIKDPCTFTPLT